MGRSRQTGRHKKGMVTQQVIRGIWGETERALAHQTDQIATKWVVWYGVGSRRFYAIATWGVPQPLIVQARSIEDLRDLMREAESETRPYGGGTAPRSTRARRSPVPSPPPQQGAPMIETPDGLRTVSWDLPHDLAMVGKARHLANEILIRWGCGDLVDDVVLVIGELLGNAICYGAPPIRLSLWATAGELCVRVTDHGTGTPRRLDLGLDAVHGRGLTIVAALAGDHGVIPLSDGPGKVVWARWRTSAHPMAKTGAQDLPTAPDASLVGPT
jgi:anti-sigma regulatory factor (Ser/Thr protein kinase)